MRYFVHWSKGECLDQSHDCGFENFATIEDAEAFRREKLAYDSSAEVIIVHGDLVTNGN